MLSTNSRKHAAWGVIWSLVAALLLVSLYTIITTRQLSDQIRGCVTPNSACYQAAREQRLETVFLINDYTIAAAVCARRMDLRSDAEVRHCIEKRVDLTQEP